MSKKKKQIQNEEEKVVYYDDGSTVSDMSNLPKRQKGRTGDKPRSTFREKWKTYWSTVRMMLLPLGVALLALLALYLILSLGLG